MHFLQLSYSLLMTFLCSIFLQTSYKLLLNFLWLFTPPPFPKNFLKTSCKCHANFWTSQCWMNSTQPSYELLRTFLQRWHKDLTNYNSGNGLDRYRYLFSATFSTFKLELKYFSGDSYKLLMNFVSAKTLNREQQW